jgi:hypothetical protein
MKLLASYGTWRFITVFTTACHWPPSWVRCIQSTFPPYIPKIHSNIILLYISKSSEWSVPFRFSNQNFVYISHYSHAYYMTGPVIGYHSLKYYWTYCNMNTENWYSHCCLCHVYSLYGNIVWLLNVSRLNVALLNTAYHNAMVKIGRCYVILYFILKLYWIMTRMWLSIKLFFCELKFYEGY